jgi:hypothetical protein
MVKSSLKQESLGNTISHQLSYNETQVIESSNFASDPPYSSHFNFSTFSKEQHPHKLLFQHFQLGQFIT